MKFIQSMITRNQINLLVFIFPVMLLGCATTRPMTVHPVIVQPAQPPKIISPSDPLKQLQHDINSILSDSIFIPVHAGIKIVSLEDGTVLYEHDSKVLMNPASNIKLITSAAALCVLDTGFQFKTSVFVDDNLRGGAIQNMYLKGYGDPSLITADLDSLAYAVHRMGINSIVHDIVVDNSFFDDNYWGAGWAWDDESDPDAPYISALSVNKNCIRITITAELNRISTTLEPNTEFVTVLNKAVIVRDSIRTPLKVRRLSLNNGAIFVVEGDMFSDTRVTQKLSLRRPEFYTGVLFKNSLRQAGVSVSGDVVSGIVPEGMHEIIRHFQPIEKIIEIMNKQSDNLSAENTLKVMGAVRNNVAGSSKSGVFIEKRFLADLGLDTTKLSLVDGSGVSRHNLFSADQMVQFLAAMNTQPRLFRIFYNSLPIAGIDGTLEDRMRYYPVVDNLRAKTGTLNGVSCLSGYVQTRDGEMLAFAMMMQNFVSSSSEYHQAQDSIGSLLAKFSRTMKQQQGSLK
jgi:D-alanyl-D-alanine carboxypeptidase/D-alanyl-D-alanine-endopeptidase (penicillin-binding protein 4)